MNSVFIVKVPGINGLGKTKGCEDAGNAILEALRSIYTNEEGKEIDISKLDLEEIHLNNSNIEYSDELIYKNAFEIFETRSHAIFLGGDHSVSYSLVRGFFDSCQNSGKEPCLIVFDAHADLMEPMQEPTHEEWLRKLIEDGFPAENILLVGVRNIWKTELEFLREKEIRVVSVNSLNEDISEMCDVIMEFSNGKELYVSIDIDVVDPAFAPATGHCEPGGLSSRQMIYLIQRINKMKNLRGVDIVEINSMKEKINKEQITVKLGAKLLAELI